MTRIKKIRELSPDELRAYYRENKRRWRERLKSDPVACAAERALLAQHMKVFRERLAQDEERKERYRERARIRAKERRQEKKQALGEQTSKGE